MVAKMFQRIETRSELSADAMFFHAARHNLRCARDAQPEIAVKTKEAAELQARFESRRKEVEYDEVLEQLAIGAENAEQHLAEVYAPLLQHVAAVHLLCVACLEAHTNVLAEERLTKAEVRPFNKNSIEQKWFRLPRLLATEGFDKGKRALVRTLG